MIEPSKIERSDRKTLSISITKLGQLKIKAPKNMPIERIVQFYNDKEVWIKNKLSSIRLNLNNYQEVIEYKKILLYGNRYPLFVSSAVNKIVIDDEERVLLPQKFNEEKKYKSLKLWYKKQAKAILNERIDYLKKSLKLNPTTIRISDSKGRWGSCNSKGIITLNFRVIMLPPRVIDYVIIHELVHLLEMNHSKKFWSVVAMVYPEYKTMREKIKEYTFALTLFTN
ncbi:MAG: SprT family zinc-dependent metalloprotease [Clostridia bacterium]